MSISIDYKTLKTLQPCIVGLEWFAAHFEMDDIVSVECVIETLMGEAEYSHVLWLIGALQHSRTSNAHFEWLQSIAKRILMLAQNEGLLTTHTPETVGEVYEPMCDDAIWYIICAIRKLNRVGHCRSCLCGLATLCYNLPSTVCHELIGSVVREGWARIASESPTHSLDTVLCE